MMVAMIKLFKYRQDLIYVCRSCEKVVGGHILLYFQVNILRQLQSRYPRIVEFAINNRVSLPILINLTAYYFMKLFIFYKYHGVFFVRCSNMVWNIYFNNRLNLAKLTAKGSSLNMPIIRKKILSKGIFPSRCYLQSSYFYSSRHWKPS